MNGIDAATAFMITHSGHSWWQARYADGKVLSEWQTIQTKLLLPVSSGRTSRWEEVPKKGMVGLRILCPNGMVGELEAPEGYKFFQLKVGGVDISTSGKGGRRYMSGHLIGLVMEVNGRCLCRAWEPVPQSVQEYDVLQKKYGELSLGYRPGREREIAMLRKVVQNYQIMWHLTDAFEDNIFDMKYQHIGRISLDVQQLKI